MSRESKTVLGIDLGGALQATTGYAVLTGVRRPALKAVGVMPRSRSANAAECDLFALLDSWQPSLVAIDAPLTLPPCLICPSSCQGPGKDRCELQAARLVWEAGGNPVTERLCEVRLRDEMRGGKPLPTMRIGQIAGRGVALARRLRAFRAERGLVGGPEAIEVYPAASLLRWGCGQRPSRREGAETARRFRVKVLGVLGEQISGLDAPGIVHEDDHAFDALIAAYTGWLAPEKLEQPPEGFNAASGWIWLPNAV
jgi:predicted nuclease with RNAse H fold